VGHLFGTFFGVGCLFGTFSDMAHLVTWDFSDWKF
jgi:hypothetical protein